MRPLAGCALAQWPAVGFMSGPCPGRALASRSTITGCPNPLAGAGDKPEGLPPHLAGPLLVAFACRELFERLEEGADGNKVQTLAFGRRYEALLAELAALYGPQQTEAVDVPTCRDPYGFGEDWP